MRRVLIDANIWLDVGLMQEKFAAQPEKVFFELRRAEYVCCVSATSIKDIYYIISRRMGRPTALEFALSVYEYAELVAVDELVIGIAFDLNFRDFEDAIQVGAAKHVGIETIITRNGRDFVGCGLTVYSPEEMLRELKNPKPV